MLSSNYSNRLFGRTRGRSKKKNHLKNYYETVDKYKFKNFNNETEYILDVGTGYGETSVFLAKQFPDKVIISCEKYIDGNIILLKNIENNKIKNILLHNGNVYDVLERINKKSFKLIWIFFPDPWPKNRHAKRRLVTSDFLVKLHKNMKENSEIYIATDSVIYVRFILNSIYKCKDYFLWVNQSKINLGIKDYFDIETKYYKKAINSQRKPSLFILRKL
jgi:tRNA (guanine-N7-)-methyltransferase